MRSERSERYYIIRLFLLPAHSLRSLRRFRRSILTAVIIDTPPSFPLFCYTAIFPYHISSPTFIGNRKWLI